MKFRFFFASAFLAACLVADQTCCDCNEYFSILSSQYDFADYQLMSHTSSLSADARTIDNDISSLRSVLDSNAVIDSGAQSTIFNVISDMESAKSDIESSVNSLRDLQSSLALEKLNIDNFQCNCNSDGGGSSSGSGDSGGSSWCGCVPYLIQIRDRIIEFQNSADTYFNDARLHFRRSQDFYVFTTNFLVRLERRLNRPDDGLYQDLQNLAASYRVGISSILLNTSTPDSIYSSPLFFDVGYDFTNEGIVSLFNLGADFNNYLVNLNTSQVIQRSDTFFSLFKNTLPFSAANKQQNPFKIGNDFFVVTNFWNKPNNGSYSVYRTNHTNWFERIEFALYGIAGMFDSSSVPSSVEQNSTGTTVLDRLSAATNAIHIAGLGTVTNSVSGLVSSLRNTFNSFSLPHNDTGNNIVFVPSFHLCGVTMPEISVSPSTWAPVSSICRKYSSMIWKVLSVVAMLIALFYAFKAFFVVSVQLITFFYGASEK